MAIYGHVLLVEARRQRSPEQILGIVDWSDLVGRRDEVEGADVGGAAQALQDEHPEAPLSLFAATETDRWTVLSDLTSALLDEDAGLARVSGELDARVLALRFDAEACGLRWYDHGELRRRIDRVGKGLSAEGEPLPVEAMFTTPTNLDQDDLLTVVQSLGVDLARLNQAARYAVLAY
jgi:hypothetical protein